MKEIEKMKWDILRVVDERTNAANSHGNMLVCSVRREGFEPE